MADDPGVLDPFGLPGIPTDWSHRHQIFSSPQSLDHQREMQQQPRFWHQAYRILNRPFLPLPWRNLPRQSGGLWGESIPNSSAAGTAGSGQYPAKYSFNGGVSCTDYLVFNTSVAGGQGSTTVVFSNSSGTTTNDSIVITNPSTGATLTLLGGTGNSGTTWDNKTGSGTTKASNFNTILNAAGNGSSVGVYSTVSGTTVTLTASQLGAVAISVDNNNVGNIATPAAGTSENFTGGTNTARMIAFKNLYSGTCSGVPTLSWQHETGGAAKTSVSLSSDGTQLAFVQSYNTSPTTATAQLVLLKPGTSATLSYPSIVTAASYRTCAAPCMTLLPLNYDDVRSSPFVDYTGDILYIGDSSGSLYKFTGVFKGTPAEVVTSPWPITVSANVLTSPVYDTSTANVFVADSGGFLYAYKAATGALIGKSSQLAATGSTGIVDAPIVDSSANTAYVFVGQDGNTSSGDKCASTAGCNGVYRFSTTAFTTTGTGTCASSNGTSWTSGTNCGAESVFGAGSATTIIYDGSFDNAYYSSSGSSGNLWTCGATGTPVPKLVYSPMSTFSSPVAIASNAINPLASATATCSPVTEILNGTTDWMYLSVSASGNQSVCSGTTTAGACLYSFKVATIPTAASAGRHVSGGTSGIVIDNTGTGGGSQVYFTYLSAATPSITCPAPSNATSGGCAVQASQAALN